MRVDIAAARYAPHVGPFVVVAGQEDAARAVAITDGAASWGSGVEASAFVADRLRTKWATPPRNLDGALGDITEAAAAIPDDLRDESFGSAFAATAVVEFDGRWFIASCGWYAALAIVAGKAEVVLRPAMWVDEQVAHGNLTAREAADHRLRHVYTQPLVGAPEATFLRSDIPAVGELAVVTIEVLRALDLTASTDWAFLSATELQDWAVGRGARADPVVLVSAA